MFVLHKNEEKTEQNSASFRKPTSIERGLRPNGYFPLMRQPPCMAEDMGLESWHDFENRINFRFLENTISYETRLSDR